MAAPKKVSIVFITFYLAIILYLVLFLTIPAVENVVYQARRNIANLTEGTSYFLAIIISFFICLIGNASVGFPIPYPFILFSFSNSIYSNYLYQGLTMGEILLNGYFWLQILGITLAGGLGSALGEFVSLLIGKGAKKVAANNTLENVQGFGKLVVEHPKSMYLYIFIAAALPIPDDPLWIALGMSEKPINFRKCLIWAWLGKNITTLFYALLPILALIPILEDKVSIITEALMLLVTITLMFFIMTFNWNKLIEKIQKRKAEKQLDSN
ncbi:MAG: hypothetical protein ACXACC_07045 [Promethearchaeota archaeon]|jgi:hypothetical protein